MEAESCQLGPEGPSRTGRRPIASRRSRLGLAPAVRYERERPGELIHIDVNKLGRIHGGPGKRITGHKRDPYKRRADAGGTRRKVIGWDDVHVAIDDCTRLAYAEVLSDEKGSTAVGVLTRAKAFFERHGMTVQAVLTDNGSPDISVVHAVACRTLGLKHLRTRPRRPQTNGKNRAVHPHDAGRLGLRRDLRLKRRPHRRP